MKPVEVCINAALEGGKAAAGVLEAKTNTKRDRDVGHHAIVGVADYTSQFEILKTLRRLDPEAWYITEENVQDSKFRKFYVKSVSHLLAQRVYIIDELDGSSSHSIGHYEWSVSVGYVERLRHTAGAIYAPSVWGGALFSAELGKGAWSQLGSDKPSRIKIGKRSLPQAYILFGPDNFMPQYPLHNKLTLKVADKARTINICGSCALGLGMVAAGKADALIQPLQNVWDWTAGKLILEEAGGSISFYEMQRGKVIPIEHLKSEHYEPKERTLGFIAGNGALVRELMKQLLALQ